MVFDGEKRLALNKMNEDSIFVELREISQRFFCLHFVVNNDNIWRN